MERPDAEGRGANECRAETAQEVAAMWAPWTVRITYRMCTRGVSARGKTAKAEGAKSAEGGSQGGSQKRKRDGKPKDEGAR